MERWFVGYWPSLRYLGPRGEPCMQSFFRHQPTHKDA
jgi:hypothetical protein